MPSTDAGTRPGLRDRPLGKALALLVVLALAFVAARSCASSEGEISQDEAIEIAREEVSWDYEDVQIRNVAEGVPQRRFWAVSFYSGRPTDPTRVTVVRVDAETGRILGVEESGP
jgi:uncharacterized membrane protein YkoI